MDIKHGFVDAVGNTPLIRLNSFSEETGCEILGKAEIDLLRTLGAEVRAVPAVPYRDANNYVKLSGRLASEMENAIWANQFDNLANRRAHYETTGREIWEQTDGKIDAWVAATGTGGTYAGVAMFLKDQNPQVHCVVADPMGSGLYSYVKTGTITLEGSSITEGIGNSRITANMEGAPIDDAIQIDDPTAIKVVLVYLWGVLWVLMSVLPWLWLNKWGQATPSLLFFVMVGLVINLVYIILNGWLRKDWLKFLLGLSQLD